MSLQQDVSSYDEKAAFAVPASASAVSAVPSSPLSAGALAAPFEGPELPIPAYLEKHYWWAYVRPWAVRVFEREWLVNLILWGCYRLLRDQALASWGDKIAGRTLQISCCYGSLTPLLAQRVRAGGGSLDVIDVAPEQLKNLRRKLPDPSLARLMLRDATDLRGLADASYDRVLLFFLPHEQPREIRAQTFAEAFRVLKPSGELQIVEFSKPRWWHPLRYIWHPALLILEPFAADLWRYDIEKWLPNNGAGLEIEKTSLFAGFYQKVRLRRIRPTSAI